MSRKINRWLTPRSYDLLLALRDGEDKYLAAEGREVWVDSERFSKQSMNTLVGLCLISPDSYGKDNCEIWVLNEEGRKIIDDLEYEPMVITSLRNQGGEDSDAH